MRNFMLHSAHLLILSCHTILRKWFFTLVCFVHVKSSLLTNILINKSRTQPKLNEWANKGQGWLKVSSHPEVVHCISKKIHENLWDPGIFYLSSSREVFFFPKKEMTCHSIFWEVVQFLKWFFSLHRILLCKKSIFLVYFHTFSKEV